MRGTADSSARPPVTMHVFSSFESGGAQLRARELMDGGVVPGRSVIVTLDSGATDPRKLMPLAEADWVALPRAGSFATVRRLVSLIRQRRPRLILSYDWGAMDAMIARWLTGSAAIVHHEDGLTSAEASREKLRRRVARRWLLRGAHGVIVPSHNRERVALDAWRVPRHRLHRIPNGVDCSRFAPASGGAVRRALEVPEGAPILGTLGRLAGVKRLDRALRAFASLREEYRAHLVVAGSGGEEASLRSLADMLGVQERVRWLGHVSRPEEILPAFDVLLLTSASEQHPRALLEAMACQVAAVCANVGDVASILPREQHPFIVSPEADGFELTLARAVSRLLDDPHERQRLGRMNRDRVRAAFGIDAMHRAFSATYMRAWESQGE